MFLAFHFREMEKVRGMFPSLSFPSVPSSPLPKALDKGAKEKYGKTNNMIPGAALMDK